MYRLEIPINLISFSLTDTKPNATIKQDKRLKRHSRINMGRSDIPDKKYSIRIIGSIHIKQLINLERTKEKYEAPPAIYLVRLPSFRSSYMFFSDETANSIENMAVRIEAVIRLLVKIPS